MPFHKIVVMGDESVGKTAIITQYVHGRSAEDYLPSSEDVYIKELEGNVKGKGTVWLHFWDTSGKICSSDDMRERYRYYTFADAVMLVYDATVPETYEKVKFLKKEIDEQSGKKPMVFTLQNKGNGSDKTWDSNASLNPNSYLYDYKITVLKKDEVESCMAQLLKECQIGGNSSSSIKRAPSKTSVNSMSNIKNKVLREK